MIEYGDMHSYEIPSPEGPKYLCFGIRKGESRPSIWICTGSPTGPASAILGRFNGVEEADAAVLFMDSMVNEVNRAIAHHARKQTDG